MKTLQQFLEAAPAMTLPPHKTVQGHTWNGTPHYGHHIIYDKKTGKSYGASTEKTAAQKRVKRLNAKHGEGSYGFMHSSEWKKLHPEDAKRDSNAIQALLNPDTSKVKK